MSEFELAMQRRRDMNSGALWASQIKPWLFLGRGTDAANLERLREHRVTHILNVADDVPNFHVNLGEFTYKNLHVGDFGSDKGISRCFGDSIAFLNNVRENDKVVLVHCANGSNRSATVVVAFIMKTETMSFEEALAAVKEKRREAIPLQDNVRELKHWEEEGFPV